MTVSILHRSIDELASLGRFGGFADPHQFLTMPAAQAATLGSNPYLHCGNRTAQIVGVLGNTVIGGIYPMPKWMVADSARYEVVSATRLFVDPQHRNTLLGIKLMDLQHGLTKDKISIDSGMSHQAREVARLMKRLVFPLSQFYYIRKSHRLFARKVPAFCAVILSTLADMCFAVQRGAIQLLARMKTWRWELREIPCTDCVALQQVTRIAMNSGKRFGEVHDTRWFEWVLQNDFSESTLPTKVLRGVYESGELIGFSLDRESDGGVGRIIEWGLVPHRTHLEPWLLLRVAGLLAARCELVTLSTADDPSISLFRRLWLYPVQEQVVAIGFKPESPLCSHDGFQDSRNWRIRPGMGDSCFY